MSKAFAFVVALTGGFTLLAGSAFAETVKFEDPKGDDKGPGNYTYPTDAVYKRGSFDLTEVEIEDKGSDIEIKVTVNSKIEDPWSSKDWDGNGFSVQMFFVFIDTDRKAGSGHKDALPGLNVTFAEDSRWEKAFIISPQGNRRLKAEINAKAAKVKNDVLIPKSVKVRGRSIVAKFDKGGLGALSKSWGFQVLMQSNEGYPDKTDLLTRKVNEFGGQHRFGGGNDYDCDPHVIDMLAGSARGEDSEKDAQYSMLKTFKCDANNPEGGTQATVTMVTGG